MKSNLFEYVRKENLIYNLSALSKILIFFILSFAIMLSFDYRFILPVFGILIWAFKKAQIPFTKLKGFIKYVLIILVLNSLFIYIFEPTLGNKIYGSYTLLYQFNDYYVITYEQLFYQFTVFIKYLSIIPLGFIFVFTTNPSELAASMNKIGVNYKISYAFSLALRYLPEIMSSYRNIALSKQTRGIDLSKNEKLSKRMKAGLAIIIPLIFSSIQRIDLIKNAMDLRGFGRFKKRSWYNYKKMTQMDYVFILASIALACISVGMTMHTGRFYNPFM